MGKRGSGREQEAAFDGDKCVSRKVQTKEGIAAEVIDREMDAVSGTFTRAIETASGRKLRWHTLDLSQVTDAHEQARRIAEGVGWGFGRSCRLGSRSRA